ncbi:MAG: hypothetical protein COA69_08515 [Robiginitomaculum sp.]|nr:MAG: hypothetical protein COA69_08515 [Robiginitomaculum sp.]
MKSVTTLLIAAASASLLFGVFGMSETAAKTPESTDAQASVMRTVLSGDWRTEQAVRDVFRHPEATLAFFGLAPGLNVVEIAPGGAGWYTNILAPYSKATGGTFTAADVSDRFKKTFGDTQIYGKVHTADFGGESEPFATASADLVLTFRSVHGWIGRGYDEKAFADFYTALKPGGILGVVEHRLPESVGKDMQGGYVTVSHVKALAKAAGFEFVGASEINANEKDTADHPFGVWTLPPTSRSANRGQETAADFDAAKYKAIGESDRFTLKFRKPE